MEKKPRSDLLCENCSQKEATHLLYYQRYYPESGKIALINPRIVCSECIQLFKGSNLLFDHQPVIVSFDTLAKWDKRLMGLTNKKQWEFSVFRNKYWTKKLHRIRYIWQNPPKDQQ